MANPHIKIKEITGGPRGEELKKLHFQETPNDNDKFHLFKGKERIHTEPDDLKNGKSFDFVYNQWCWSVTDFRISKEKSSGDWLSKSCIDNDDPESGTFQAQAGPRLEAERKALSAGK